MANRPSLLDLRANTAVSSASTSSRALRSPRLHVAGEIPPELSPLDAFALQSRLLARQLQGASKDGNRISRLPPLTVESPLIVQGRSDYFRSMSADSGSELAESPLPTPDGLGFRTEVEDAFSLEDRPRSMHPRMSRIPPTPDDRVPELPESFRDFARGRQATQSTNGTDYFGARQERSPSPLRSDTQSLFDCQSTKSPGPRGGPLPSSLLNSGSTTSPRRFKQSSFDEIGLAPPRNLFPRRSSSNLSSSPTAAEEESFGTMAASVPTLPSRKLSSGSTVFSHHPSSPAAAPFQRPSSAASQASSVLPRPAFNFSRPMSRSGTPNLDLPIRQLSSDSQPSFILADDTAQTPVSMHSEAFLEHPFDDKASTTSYIYSKFTLPRGKMLQRDESSDNKSHEPPEQERLGTPLSSDQQVSGAAPPSPPTRPSSSSARTIPDDAVSMVSNLTKHSTDTAKTTPESSTLGPFGYPSPNPSRPSNEVGRSFDETRVGRSQAPLAQEIARGKTPASASTSDTASTIRQAPVSRPGGPIASEMSAEEHLAKGIACHESGSLNESTYHLRHAARMNNPTAMLLYALACRHGWGMRPNQKEGVEWLRKAAEFAGIEMADDEDQAKEGKRINIADMKAHKAQFALSIYELGVSHMNGWGIEQDKVLALRCFEIAGTWGDVDALAETGFCYAQGIGCKKNLKKSAKFYRMAEAKGMSMVGNSWIHKSKYKDDDEKEEQKDKKNTTRSKSRSRSLFGRKNV